VNRLRELTIEQGSYPQYSDYRRYVLKPAVEELNSLNLDVKYIEHKQGRAVNAVEFHIKTRKHHKTQQLKLSLTESAPDENPSKLVSDLTPLQEKVRTRLGKLKLTESQVRKVLQVVTAEAELTKLLKETYPILRDFETKVKPGENVAAATMALLKSTFPAIWAAN
jgi:plasmid replication initiation protein